MVNPTGYSRPPYHIPRAPPSARGHGADRTGDADGHNDHREVRRRGRRHYAAGGQYCGGQLCWRHRLLLKPLRGLRRRRATSTAVDSARAVPEAPDQEAEKAWGRSPEIR